MERIGVDRQWLVGAIERRAVEGHGAPTAMEDLDIRRLAGSSCEAPKIAGWNQVVGVKEEHELAPDVRQRGVSSSAFTAVLLSMESDRLSVIEEDRQS